MPYNSKRLEEVLNFSIEFLQAEEEDKEVVRALINEYAYEEEKNIIG